MGGFVIIERTNRGISTFDPDTKEIIIHEGHKPENLFYNLIHEMGHFIISKNYRKYRNTIRYTQGFSYSSQVRKVSEVEEEFEAWKVGYQKAKQLRLFVDNRNFEIVKASCLMAYFCWAVDGVIKQKMREVVSVAHETGGDLESMLIVTRAADPIIDHQNEKIRRERRKNEYQICNQEKEDDQKEDS